MLSLRLTDTITPEEEPRHDSCMSVFPARHFEAVLPTAFDIYTPTIGRCLEPCRRIDQWSFPTANSSLFFCLFCCCFPIPRLVFLIPARSPPADRPTDRPSDRCLSIRLSERFKDTAMLVGRKDFGVFQYLSKSPM